MKNKSKPTLFVPCVSLPILAIQLMLSSSAFADAQYGFVRVTCIKELDLFEIESSRVFNLPPSAKKRLRDFNPGMPLGEKYGFFSYEKPIKYQCGLRKREIIALVTPREVTNTGECGGEVQADIRLKENGTTILEDTFGSACFPSVNRVTAFPVGKDNPSIWRVCSTSPEEGGTYPTYYFQLKCVDM
jgi:hypothetical protein